MGETQEELQHRALEDEEDDAMLEVCSYAARKEALVLGEFFHHGERSSFVYEVCEAWGWDWLNVCSGFFYC